MLATINDAWWTTGMVLTPSHTIFHVHITSKVFAVPRAGGEAKVVADKQVDAFGVQADDSGVYWTSREGLRWASLDGSQSRLLVAMEWKGAIGKVALAPDAIYVSDPGAGTVSRLAK